MQSVWQKSTFLDEGGTGMLSLARGTVMRVVEKRSGMQIVELKMAEDGEVAQALSFSNEAYEAGEILIVNTTAVRLRLGTGGYHLVVSKAEECSERDVAPGMWGHVMKMRYAPWQLAVDTVEEQESPYHSLFVRDDLTLEGTPVIIGELHSLLPVVAAALRQNQPEAKVVYVMPDGASLPVAMSRHVHQCKSQGLLNAVVTTGHAWGGDREAVTIHSGLLAAKHVEKADVILCMLGPGVAGTGTPYAFSGVQLAEVVHAVSVLNGVPFFLPRISFADPRLRHRGVSHHTMAILGRYVLRPVVLIMPKLSDDRDSMMAEQIQSLYEKNHVVVWGHSASEDRLSNLEQQYGMAFSSMGRSWQEDPVPFFTALLAADLTKKSFSFSWKSVSADSDCYASPNNLEALGLFLTRNEAQL